MVHKICNRHKGNKYTTNIDEIISVPLEGQKIIKLSENYDLTFTKPYYFFYRTYKKRTESYYSLAIVFYDLLKEINPEKLVEYSEIPYKLTPRSKPYISADKDEIKSNYEVIQGVYCDTNFSANKLFEVMKDLSLKFGLDLNEVSFTLELDEE